MLQVWIPISSLIFSIALGFLLVYSSFLSKKLTNLYAATAIFLGEFGVFTLLFGKFSLFISLAAISTLLRAINFTRFSARRMNIEELRSRFKSSELVLSLSTVLLVLAHFSLYSQSTLIVLSVISLTASIILFINTLLTIYSNRPSKIDNLSGIDDLPTVSVCIPARNETEDLTDCIESLLKSTYQKLEIIVLDDCSHDKTPQIIKKYAHDGVRFIEGQEPESAWLAKNLAYQRLYEESSGEIVIFAGVDVRFGPDTVMNIVKNLDSKTDMLSTLPWRDATKETSLFIQPLRYWWELAVPRLRKARPPVLSSCWAIKRVSLKEVGEFNSVKSSVIPEIHFAHRLKNRYKFLLSGERLNITSIKRPSEQFNTALRTRYPIIKRRPETVFFVLIVEIVIFVGPIIGIIVGILGEKHQLINLSLLAVLIQALTNVAISSLVVKKTWAFALVTLPYLLMLEWYLLIRSMVAYEFGVVRWKERNICIPMLQVEKSLPKI